MSEPATSDAIKPGRCPQCGAPNGCRLETGEAYKGACWCESVELSREAAERLREAVPVARCLCAECLRQYAK